MKYLLLKAIAFGNTALTSSMVHTNPKSDQQAAKTPIVTSEEDRQRLVRAGMVDPKFVKEVKSFDDFGKADSDGDETRTIGETGALQTKELAGSEESDAGATGLSNLGAIAFQDGPLPTGLEGSDQTGGTGIDAADPDAAPAPTPTPSPSPTPTPTPAASKAPATKKAGGNGK